MQRSLQRTLWLSERVLRKRHRRTGTEHPPERRLGHGGGNAEVSCCVRAAVRLEKHKCEGNNSTNKFVVEFLDTMGLLHGWLLVAAVAGAATPYRGGTYPRRPASLQQKLKGNKGNEILAGISSSVAFSDASATDLEAQRECPDHSHWVLPVAACVCEKGFLPSTTNFGRSCLPGKAATNMFDTLDTNENGILDRQEFMRGIKAPASTQSANSPGPFEQSDLDEDGFIERAEFSGPKGLNNIVLPRFPEWIDAVKVAVSLVSVNSMAANALLSAAAAAPALKHHPALVQAIKFQRAWFDKKNAKRLFVEVAALDSHSSYKSDSRANGHGASEVLVEHLRKGGFLPAYSRGQGSCLAAEMSLADLGSSGSQSAGISPSQRDGVLNLLTACYTLVPRQAAFGLQAAFHVVDLSLAGVPTCCSKLLELDSLMYAHNATRLDLRIRAAEIQMICGNSSGAVHILRDALAPHGYGFPTPDTNFLAPGKYTEDRTFADPAVPLAAQFLASRLAVIGRLFEAEALCQRLVSFGFTPPAGSGTTCATTFAVVHARRGNYRRALRELQQETSAQRSTVTHAVDARSEKKADMRRDRHAAEIVTAWLHASRFHEPAGQQPTYEMLGTLVNKSNLGSLDPHFHVSSKHVSFEVDRSVNGGWDHRENLALAGDGRCNIDVRYPGIDISPEQFQREFLFLNRPVVLRGLCRNWPAMKSWSREPLLDNYGDLMFKAKRGSDIAQDKIHANDPAFAEGVPRGNFEYFYEHLRVRLMVPC